MDKVLLLLAFDALLLELDDDYEGYSEEKLHLIKAKVYENYGFKVTSSEEDLREINALLLRDIREYRAKLFDEISEK